AGKFPFRFSLLMCIKERLVVGACRFPPAASPTSETKTELGSAIATPDRTPALPHCRRPPTFDKFYWRLYKDHMKTLTITDAKRNLSRWLAAASRGEDVGIVCGADIIALRKVEVESTDYAQREYGATPGQVAALEIATDRRYRTLKRSRKLVTVTAEQLRKMID
ncbi:MAG: type II toxin-antitoxin system Phd/YefM family antitoxin, partial [Candidatus Binatia bacterium]